MSIHCWFLPSDLDEIVRLLETRSSCGGPGFKGVVTASQLSLGILSPTSFTIIILKIYVVSSERLLIRIFTVSLSRCLMSQLRRLDSDELMSL